MMFSSHGYKIYYNTKNLARTGVMGLLMMYAVGIILVGATSVFLAPIDSVYAESMEDFQLFKDQAVSQVYEQDEYVPLMDTKDARRTLENLTRSYDEISTSLTQLQARKQEVSHKKKSASIIINRVVNDMEETQSTLKNHQRNATLLLSKISSFEKQGVVIQDDIDRVKEFIELYSRFLFKTTNDFYLSSDEISSLKLFSKSDRVSQSLSKDQMVRLLHEELQVSFEYMTKLFKELDQIRLRMNISRSLYLKDIQEVKKDLEYLDQQKSHVDELIKFLEKDESYLDDELFDLEQSQDNLDEEIDRIEHITETVSDFLQQDRGSAVKSLLANNDQDDGSRYFSRPVRIPGTLLDQDQVSSQPAPSAGLILDTQQGDDVFAPAPGIVYKVYSDPGLGLSRVMLLHKHGYVSVLSPFSQIFVKEKQIVARGDIIGRSGGKPGTTGSGVHSVRPHLSFELFKNSVAYEPFLALDMSVYRSPDLLDDAYRLKWKQDYNARIVDLSDLPTLQGNTVQQRRDNFLSRTGGNRFSDPNLRVGAADEYGIDPVFGICIGAAETSYKNFKSGNNIGNVGNTDSGATITFATPRDGVRSIFKTLNNKYLGGYTSMDQLSRFGNSTGPIYASSEFNWQKNIMRCMSMIYEVNVSEDYFFRSVK